MRRLSYRGVFSWLLLAHIFHRETFVLKINPMPNCNMQMRFNTTLPFVMSLWLKLTILRVDFGWLNAPMFETYHSSIIVRFI